MPAGEQGGGCWLPLVALLPPHLPESAAWPSAHHYHIPPALEPLTASSLPPLQIHHYLGPAYLPLGDIYAREGPSDGGEADEDDPATAGWAGGPAAGPAAARHRAGVAANFGRVHAVSEALGSVPAMVSGEDFVAHGPEERAVVLFTAFLCARLVEVSREERAAMVVQRLWRRRQLERPGARLLLRLSPLSPEWHLPPSQPARGSLVV